jgi:hypothetical protein
MNLMPGAVIKPGAPDLDSEMWEPTVAITRRKGAERRNRLDGQTASPAPHLAFEM